MVPGPVYTDPMAIAAPSTGLCRGETTRRRPSPRLTALFPDTVVCVLQNGVEQRQQFAP